jgi:hypothetical protein
MTTAFQRQIFLAADDIFAHFTIVVVWAIKICLISIQFNSQKPKVKTNGG